MTPVAQRVRFARLTEPALDALHELARDPHVRRYLLDGEQVSRAWCDAILEASDALHDTTGLALYLVERDGAPIGFAGFHVFDDVSPEPQLLYALLEAHPGCGLATEVAEALVTHAFSLGRGRVEAAVDAPNVASIRVLEKVGFARMERTVPGAFGDTLLFELHSRKR
ncbi:MAG: GNAT family N-acetyltransferase [Sandaracinaceae bacterium]